MRLSATVFSLLVLASCGGTSGEESPSGLEVYHLEAAWSGPRPVAEEPEDSDDVRVVRCEPPTRYCPGLEGEPTRTYYYEFTTEPALTSRDIADARAGFYTGEPTVLVTLTAEGERRFRALTRRVAQAGKDAGTPHAMALVVDGRLVSTPVIDYRDNPDGIEGRQMEIVGIGDGEEVKKLAEALRED